MENLGKVRGRVVSMKAERGTERNGEEWGPEKEQRHTDVGRAMRRKQDMGNGEGHRGGRVQRERGERYRRAVEKKKRKKKYCTYSLADRVTGIWKPEIQREKGKQTSSPKFPISLWHRSYT